MEIGELEKTAAQYSDIIYRVALQYTAHPCDAEDVLQEVLMELFRKSEVFESPDHERRWLLRVTINKSKNLLRRGKRHHTLSIEELPETAAPPETSYRELYEAVLSLPRNQRLTVDEQGWLLRKMDAYCQQEMETPLADVRKQWQEEMKQVQSAPKPKGPELKMKGL